jgi:hypothetical protein
VSREALAEDFKDQDGTDHAPMTALWLRDEGPPLKGVCQCVMNTDVTQSPPENIRYSKTLACSD